MIDVSGVVETKWEREGEYERERQDSLDWYWKTENRDRYLASESSVSAKAQAIENDIEIALKL